MFGQLVQGAPRGVASAPAWGAAAKASARAKDAAPGDIGMSALVVRVVVRVLRDYPGRAGRGCEA